MSEISGFDWWFRNRDYVLRESLESLEADSAAAVARSARLSSQLSRLQGSLETRLNALSAAFDAYVQLGDIREQLASYADAATIRREALAAIGHLGDGRPAQPVDDRDTGYWVAAATNALITRVSGTPDPAAEEELRGQEPDADLFLAAACGALGRGPDVSDRVLDLLHSKDGLLDRHQVTLWRATLRGEFGESLISAVLAGWADHLVHAAEADWWSWIGGQAAGAGQDPLDWIEDRARGVPPDHDQKPSNDFGHTALIRTSMLRAVQRSEYDTADDQPAGTPEDDLRGLVLELINSGFGDEKELLMTARELRARIENPGRAAAAGGGEPPERTPVVDVVRTSYQQSAGSAAGRATFAALAPTIAAAVEAESSRLLTEHPAVVQVRSSGVTIEVTPEGPDRQALAKAARADAGYADPAASSSRLYGYGGGAAGCAVLALLLALSGVATPVAVLLAVAAIILGLLAVRSLLARRREQQRLQLAAADRDRAVEEAVQEAERLRDNQRETVRSTADQLDRIRGLLTAPAAPASTASTLTAPVTVRQNAGPIG